MSATPPAYIGVRIKVRIFELIRVKVRVHARLGVVVRIKVIIRANTAIASMTWGEWLQTCMRPVHPVALAKTHHAYIDIDFVLLLEVKRKILSVHTTQRGPRSRSACYRELAYLKTSINFFWLTTMQLVRVSRWLVKLALALAMADRDCSAVGVDVGGNILVGSHLVTLGITPHQPWQCASFWSHRKGPSWQGQGVDSSVGLDGSDLADLALGDLVEGIDLLVSNALGLFMSTLIAPQELTPRVLMFLVLWVSMSILTRLISAVVCVSCWLG